MAAYMKRKTSKGKPRWTASIRRKGCTVAKTFPTKGAAEAWATAQERIIDEGEFTAATPPGAGPILSDLVDAFVAHRLRIRRPPGKTFANALVRLKDRYGLESAGDLTVAFWRRHANGRLAKGIDGSTIASDLAYATTVLRHAAGEGIEVDATAPGIARTAMRHDGVRVVSRERTRRISDAELARLFAAIDAVNTHVPLRDIVDFALATAMRRGEILALKWTDISGRVALIRRKHPTDRERVESVPLLKPQPHGWPRVDPVDIINRQPKGGARVFPYQGDTVAWTFERACEAAGIDGIVFHGLRHEALSRLAERGFDPLRLALVGGHRDLRNVRRYARIDPAVLANE